MFVRLIRHGLREHYHILFIHPTINIHAEQKFLMRSREIYEEKYI